ncbi:glutamate 5-kinase [Sphingomonas sp. C3-2]|uniref:glutamate 5-kinase n=1 Tax=Sphingomonas sp. C3-2 TaxID=3062169 RepID=UPI00294B6A3F|nr:glutamate 5-kinase [Sphingomonas sp. C3-2]WOK35744.1 glutamate 5-kinase [Sphingomonas sp. C3-2]
MVADLTHDGARFAAPHCPRLIVKVGSSLLVDPAGAIRAEWLATLVADIAAQHKAGQQIAIVSSGAIALGARRLKLPKGGRASLEDAQAAAATGQIALSQIWADLLAAHGIVAAQMLLTLDDLEDRRRYLNASATLDRLLTLGVIPIINENDSVATAEIRFGDNDRLGARVGQAAGAQGVILLSDVDGLYTANPMDDPSATLIPRVEKLDPAILAMADGRTASGMGSGGMISKLEAARIANSAGAALVIASGKRPHPLAHYLDTAHGTIFLPERGSRARKAWLAGRMRVTGRVHIDAGAADALAQGKSLLAAGTTAIEGAFERGDVIDIVGPEGQRVARGLAEYDNGDAARIIGRRKDELAAILGYAPRTAFIHRDHLVLL